MDIETKEKKKNNCFILIIYLIVIKNKLTNYKGDQEIGSNLSFLKLIIS